MNPVKDFIQLVINRFIAENQLEYTADKQFFQLTATKDGKSLKSRISEKSINNQFQLYAVMHQRFYPPGNSAPVKVSKDDFKAGFSEWKTEASKKAFEDLRKALAFRKEAVIDGRIKLEDWLHSVLWRPPTSMEMAVMLHFLHQVKRKMNGLKVQYHVMPVLVAGQGSGKTESIKWLMEPLGHLFVDSNLEALEDSRNDMQYEYTYVMMLDELSKADKADIRALKQRITASRITTRLFHTQDLTDIPMNTSFIGASNEPVSAMIQDSTGMRRYFQIKGPNKNEVLSTPIEKRREFWNKKGGVGNVFQIWQSIDEAISLLPEYVTEMQNITEAQELLKSIDIVEEFLVSRGYIPITEEEEATMKPDVCKHIKSTDLYREFTDFCEDAGERFPIGRNTFIAKIRAAGFNFKYKWINGLAQRVIAYRKATAADHAGFELVADSQLETDDEKGKKVIDKVAKLKQTSSIRAKAAYQGQEAGE